MNDLDTAPSTLPAVDLGAASGSAREYDPNVAANPESNAQLGGLYRFGAAANEALTSSAPVESLALVGLGMGGSKLLSSDEANAKYGVQGSSPSTSLSWKPGQTVYENQAQLAQQITQGRNHDEYIQSLRPQTWAGWAPNAAGDFLGSALDPLNTAASMVPVGWLGRGAEVAFNAANLADKAAVAASVAKDLGSTVAGRVTAAGLQNAGGVALMQPLIFAGAQADHQDYSFGTAAQNILFGGILGAGIHGIGEGLGTGLKALADGSTARGMLRGGIASMDSEHTLDPNAAEDMLAASRPQVTDDLTKQLGRPPTEDEIASTIEQRSAQFMENKAAGKYDPQITAPEDIDAPEHLAEENQLLQQGDHAGAAQMAQEHVASMEQDPAFKVEPEDKPDVEMPTDRLAKAQSAIQDFISCIGAEAS